MSETSEVPTERRAPVTFMGLEVLRLFACSLIVLYHAHSMIRSVPKPDGSMIGHPDVAWHFALDIFFVMSGFIATVMAKDIYGKQGAPGFFALKRLVRIVPLYWLFTAVFACLFLIAAGQSHGADFVTFPRFVASLFFWPVEGGPIVPLGWTLNYEMLFYALFTVSLFFSFARGTAFLLFVIFAAVIAGKAIPLDTYPLAFWVGPLMLDFAWGILLALLYVRGVRLPLWACLIAGLAALYPLSIPDNYFDILDIGRPFTLGVGSALITASIVFMRRQPDLGNLGAVVARLDKSVFSIYLSHVISLKALQICYQSLRFDVRFGPIPFIVAASSIAFLAGFIFHLTIEKPLTNYLRKRVI